MRHLRSAAVLLLFAALPCCSRQERVASIGPATVKARTGDADPAVPRDSTARKRVTEDRHISHVKYVKLHRYEIRHTHEYNTITLP
jgi:hypothetical protein